MLQPAMGSITCSVCDASYESETALYEHQRASHRGRGAEPGPATAPDGSIATGDQPCQE
jgi:hypothetical protein